MVQERGGKAGRDPGQQRYQEKAGLQGDQGLEGIKVPDSQTRENQTGADRGQQKGRENGWKRLEGLELARNRKDGLTKEKQCRNQEGNK